MNADERGSPHARGAFLEFPSSSSGDAWGGAWRVLCARSDPRSSAFIRGRSLVLGAAFLGNAATACTLSSGRVRFELSGRVIDSLSAQPVPGAWVDMPELQLRAEADSSGRFLIRGKTKAGCYRIRARGIAHFTTEQLFDLRRPGPLALGDITLVETTIPEDSPRVHGGCAGPR